MNTHLSTEEVNRDATELIRRVVRKFDWGNRKWFAGERSELLTEGHSPLVVSKAREFDLKERIYGAAGAVFIGLEHAIVNSHSFSRPIEALFVLWLTYLIYQYRSRKLSDADNKIVWEELTSKASNEPAPKPFLWRLDALLSGNK